MAERRCGMTWTLEADTQEVIGLEECIRRLAALGDLSDRDNVTAAAAHLRRLANNKRFLVELVNCELHEIEDLESYQRDNVFPQQVIDLGGGDGFRLRANLWPPGDKEHPAEWERNLFAYHRPHDHDSDFMTIGYWGPGYETEIYEYDPEKVIGYAGEPVELRFLERTRLTEGKIMFYRANRDIHTQLPPDEFSISINLLIARPGQGLAGNQFWFDVEKGVIQAPIDRITLTSSIFSCRLAAFLGDSSRLPPLQRITQQHQNAQVRAQAYRSLVQLDPTREAEYRQEASRDPHPFVRLEAEKSPPPIRDGPTESS
jgi:hypothetical protein